MQYIISGIISFFLLTACTVFFGIMRIKVVLDYIQNETLAKAMLLPVNILYISAISYGFLRITD